jgi:phosphatidylinositol alpha-1,6-mannosyltransferase
VPAHDLPDVLFVTRPLSPPWNDSGKVLPYLLAREMPGLRIGAMTPAGSPLPFPNVTSEEIYPAGTSFSSGLLDKARLFSRLLCRDVPPVVHFFFSPNPPTTAAARVFRVLRRSVRVVQTVMSLPRNPADLDGSLFGDVIVTWSVATAERVRIAIEQRGLRAKAVHVPPGVEPIAPMSREAKRRVRAGLGVSLDLPLVLFAGDLEFGSGAAITAEALPRVLDRIPSTFVFANRIKTERARSIRRELERTLAPWIARGRVRIPDRVDSFPDLLAAADVQVFPSETTHAKTDLPMVVLEGITAGVPAIVCTGTPLDELVDLGAAMGVPPMNPDRLADAVIGLISRPGVAESFGARSRSLVSARHSPAAMAAAHEAIYRELLHWV